MRMRMREATESGSTSLYGPGIGSTVSPAGGAPLLGIAIAITGRNLSGVTGVTIGGQPATLVIVVSDVLVTAVSPLLTAGAYTISLATTGGPVNLDTKFVVA